MKTSPQSMTVVDPGFPIRGDIIFLPPFCYKWQLISLCIVRQISPYLQKYFGFRNLCRRREHDRCPFMHRDHGLLFWNSVHPNSRGNIPVFVTKSCVCVLVSFREFLTLRPVWQPCHCGWFLRRNVILHFSFLQVRKKRSSWRYNEEDWIRKN